MGQIPLGQFYACSFCGKDVWKKPSRTFEEKFCNGRCYFRGKRKHPNKKAYKSKVIVSGYAYLYMPTHPNAIKGHRYIAEHRYNLEKKIRRYLQPGEISHHRNGDKLDNRSENLELKTVSAHNRDHALHRRRKKNGSFA